MISCRSFLKDPQKIDLFLHPRYIQQSQHIHDFFEMKYQMKGNGTVHAGKSILFLKEGDICIISPYVLHSSEIYTDEAVMINIVIPGDNLAELLPRIMSFSNLLQMYFSQNLQTVIPQMNSLCLHFETGGNAEIRDLVSEMVSYYSKNDGRSFPAELQMEADLERIFLILLQLKQTEDLMNRKPDTAEKPLSEVTAYIRRHLKDVALPDVASLLHFSQPYTSRFIRRETGYTFQMIVLILRMEEAARLLRETDWTVDRIAQQVGMSGKTNFYRQFQSFYGMNPGTYRRSL